MTNRTYLHCQRNAAAMLAAWAMLTSPCFAWNESGHQLINLLAFAQLSADCKAGCLTLLRQHPVFERHFLGSMPEQVWRETDDVKDLWVFAHAGQWPDLIRGDRRLVTAEEQARYNRPDWHFCDGPIFLRSSDRATLEAPLPTLKLGLEAESEVENAVQAIAFLRQRLEDKSLEAGERAVALCWLTHLVADLHQPCHAATLYSTGLYPEGDAGASALPIKQRGRSANLHSLWDNALLGETDFETVRVKAERMSKEIADRPKAALERLDPRKLFQESHDLAEEFVYTNKVRTQIEQWEEASSIGELKINSAYLTTMRRVANERALLASQRLAALIESSFSKGSD